MYLSSTPTAELWPDTLKGALRAIAIAAVFWAHAATLLYLLSPGLDTWPRPALYLEKPLDICNRISYRRGWMHKTRSSGP